MTITRQQGRLFGQPTGQSIQEIFASDQKEFFLKTVNAQITFETDAQGRAVAIVVHQNGVDTRAARIE
jgi:hypothetical protein